MCKDHCVNVLSWSTAGERGFRVTKKATPFAIQITMLQKLLLANIKTIEVEIYGMENNRDVVLKTLHSSSLTITCVRDVTPKPHNGCSHIMVVDLQAKKNLTMTITIV